MTRAGLRMLMEAIPTPMLLLDQGYRVVETNQAFCTLSGHSCDFWRNARPEQVLPPASFQALRADYHRVLETGEELETETTLDLADRVPRRLLIRRRRLEVDGETMVLTVLIDMTAHRAAEARSRYLAHHDELTGLANRALLGQRVQNALTRSGGGAALLLIDIERFKDVNDAFGHAAGDALLRGFAERIAALAHDQDTVARLGGDEFALLIADVEGPEQVAAIGRRIAAVAAEPFPIESGAVTFDLAIGAAWGEPGLDADALHRRADLALHEIKQSGEGGFRLYESALSDRRAQRKRLECDMRAALSAGDQFEVHYQPVMEASGKMIAGMEALVRWRHPRLGLLAPGGFIAIAEQCGLIVPLGEWVLDQAVAMMARFPGVALAVNLSPVQLRSNGIDDRIFAILAAHRFPPCQLQLEITENAMLGLDAGVRARLARLRAEGVQLVLDDFGTGYSSLSHLHRLAVDRVKIDQSFVRDLAESQDARAIIQAVLGMGQSLGIRVTAEGVEDEKQRIFLRAFGCNEFQGYLFSRPLARADAEAMLEQVGAGIEARRAA